jgi:hypothetical protein
METMGVRTRGYATLSQTAGDTNSLTTDARLKSNCIDHACFDQRVANLSTFLTPTPLPTKVSQAWPLLTGHHFTIQMGSSRSLADVVLWKQPIKSLLLLWRRFVLMDLCKAFDRWSNIAGARLPVSAYSSEQWQEVARLREERTFKLTSLIHRIERNNRIVTGARIIMYASSKNEARNLQFAVVR